MPVEQGVAWGGASREGWSSGVLCRHTGTVEAQRFGEKCVSDIYGARAGGWPGSRDPDKCYFFMTFWRKV